MVGPPHDLVIVGGGIIGATTALLAQRSHPDWSVLLVDRGTPGHGATRRSAALGTTHRSPDRALVLESLAAFRDGPLRRYRTDVPAFAVLPAAGAGALQRAVVSGRLARTGSRARRALHAAYPDLRVGAGEEVLEATGHVFTVDAARIVRDAIRPRAGFACLPASVVSRIARDAGLWEVVCGGGERVRAWRVVVATGPWQPPPIRHGTASRRRTVEVKRVAALQLARPGDGRPLPAVLFPAEDCFLLPDGPRLLFSFPRDVWLAPGQPLAGDFDAADAACGVAHLRRRSDALAAAVRGGRAFFDAYAPQRRPLVATDPDAPGLAQVLGGSGSGVRLAPALARRAIAAVECRQDHDEPGG